MHVYAGINPVPAPPILIGQGLWTLPQIPDGNNDRSAENHGAMGEALMNCLVFLHRRYVNGLEGGGPYPGDIAWTGDHTFTSNTINLVGADIEMTANGINPAVINVNAGCQINIDPSGVLRVKSGGSFIADGGSVVTFNNTPQFNLGLLVNNGTLNMSGDLLFVVSPSTFNGTVAFTNLVSMNGINAYTALRDPIALGDADIAFPGPEARDLYVVPTLTANRSWTFGLPASNRVVVVRICRRHPLVGDAFNLTIRNHDGTSIAVFPPANGTYAALELVFDGDNWMPFGPTGPVTITTGV